MLLRFISVTSFPSSRRYPLYDPFSLFFSFSLLPQETTSEQLAVTDRGVVSPRWKINIVKICQINANNSDQAFSQKGLLSYSRWGRKNATVRRLTPQLLFSVLLVSACATHPCISTHPPTQTRMEPCVLQRLQTCITSS